MVREAAYAAGVTRHVRVTHASGTGDDAIVAEVTILAGRPATRSPAVTADRMLQARVEGLGAQVVGPNWLLDQLGE